MKTQTTLKMIPQIGFHHRKPWAIILIVFIFLGLSVLPVVARNHIIDPISQPEAIGPISQLNDDQFAPEIAYADPPVNEYLVVWEEVYETTDYDIYARLVNNDGSPIGIEIIIANSRSMESHPGVSYSPAMQEFLIVWGEKYSDTDHRIYAIRMGTDGSLVGDLIYVASTGAYDEKPVVTYNPETHEYLVVYERTVGADEFKHQDLYAQRVNENGTVAGNQIAVATGLLDEQAAAVASDGTDYLVVWQGDEEGTDETNIYGQRIESTGLLIGGRFGISTWTGDQLVPRVTYNNNEHHYFVVWEDHHYTYSGIYGYRVDQFGNLVEPQVSISASGNNNRTDPDVVYIPETHSYLAVWQFEYLSNDHDIYSIRIAYDGSHPDGEIPISTTGSEEKHPRVTSNGGNRRLVVWEDWRNYNTSGVDIYGSEEPLIIPVFSGNVYAGDIGVITDPIPGVLVELGCSNSEGVFGELIGQVMTNPSGEYMLPAYILCEYYNIRETDPAGYYSIGSETVDGIKLSSNWIYYTYPLAGKELRYNNFWDKIQGIVDDTPPGNWANFKPSGWVNNQTVDVSEQVEDTWSGLDVSTAEFQYSNDGGASWSGWSAAAITGVPGTTSPQVISASAPFGRDSESVAQNLVQFRVKDMEGNQGESPVQEVKIDTVVPNNPTTADCPTHPVNVWTSNSLISCNWSGATDASSGIAGYNVDWNATSDSIPSPFIEFTGVQADSGPMSDGTWYFHVRALDLAGNAATGATHYGPILIDTEPPTAWITTSAGSVNTRTINVGWSGGDTGSGVYSYDVQTNVDSAGWNDWQSNTQASTAVYTGDNGQEASFRVRATDAAGNVGEWSSSVSITFGANITVQVKNESGSTLPGAKVYHLGTYQGITNASGNITVYDALIGDTLSALYLIHTESAGKPSHSMGGSISWAWRVYLTSVQIPTSGTPQQFTISNTSAVQVLTVKKDQALIGMHIVAVVLWDANSTFLDDLEQGLMSASSFLYDVTDGQIFFEMVEIYDNEEMGAANDYIIYADNTVWPNAFVGAITEKTGRMYFPPLFGSSWSSRVAYGTLIHEFGHYGLWLYDEYLKRDGSGGGFCTYNRNTSNDETTRASIMDDSDDASELCSEADPNHLHNTDTDQDAQNGGSTWETVLQKYGDSTNPSRWTLQSPDTRSVTVVTGPTAIPVADWMDVYVHDNVTNACDPYTVTITYLSGTPVANANVSVESPTGSALGQGTTSNAGVITIRGAHNGDELIVTTDTAYGIIPISCTPSALSEQSQVEQETVIIEPFPFTMAVSTVPLSANTVQVQVKPSVDLPSAPQVQLWQELATEPIAVALTYDSGSGMYIGQAILSSELDLKGYSKVSATDAENHTIDLIVPFSLVIVDEEGLSWVKSSDGRMEVFLPAGSLTGNPTVSIQPTSQVNTQQGKLMLIGSAYEVISSSGTNTLQLPAVMNIYFSAEQLIQQQNQLIGLYRWDATNQTWVFISPNVDMNKYFVSGQITELGIYAVLAQPMNFIDLPLINK
jgi:hypothetical protein